MIVLPSSLTHLIPSDMANLRYNIVYLPHVDRRMSSFCRSYTQVSSLLWRRKRAIEVFRSQIADETREEGILEEKFKKIIEMNKVVKKESKQLIHLPIFSYPSIYFSPSVSVLSPTFSFTNSFLSFSSLVSSWFTQSLLYFHLLISPQEFREEKKG